LAFFKRAEEEYLKLREQEREAEVFAAHFLILEEKLDAILKEEWVRVSRPDLRTS